MNPYANSTLNNLLTDIQENQLHQNTSIDEIGQLVWEKISSEREGALFIRALRKGKHFYEAEDYIKKLKIKFSNSKRLKTEELWLEFSSKVCDPDNNSFLEDAQSILSNTSQNNPETKLIYEITALFTISRLIRGEGFKLAYTWTTKLNPIALSDKGRTGENGIYYPSNKQQFYNYKAQALIGLNGVKVYLDWVFKQLHFIKEKNVEFTDYVINSCSFQKYKGEEYISSMVLSNFLYKLDLDSISGPTRLSVTTSQPEAILLSELSQYLFCPVSFVINKTYNIPINKPMDSSLKWDGNKDGFYDRYLQYQKGINIKDCFKYDTFIFTNHKESIKVEDEELSIFEELFKGSLKVNNSLNNTPFAFKSDDKSIKGAPDYLIELKNGKRVIVAEKFSRANSAGASKIYNSDIINLEAYLTKFKKMKIDYAYFINWNWSIHKKSGNSEVQDTNHLYVNKVTLKIIDLSLSREPLVDSIINKINILQSGNELKFKNIGFPGKCLNCSVYNYCEHKSGIKNELRFPYNY